MKIVFFLALVITGVYMGCTDGPQPPLSSDNQPNPHYIINENGDTVFSPVIMSPRNLPTTKYTINIDRDTTLTTSKGAIIYIPKGALNAPSPTTILTIKEAYTIADIIKGGLTTMSGNNPLSSGGMIYVSTADNKSIHFAKPIRISIPTKQKQVGMSLFKGTLNPDSTINWNNPQLIDQPRLAGINGKALFQTNCAACHSKTKDATGPALAFIGQRRDKKWLYAFTRNSADVICRDKYASCLFERYNKTYMPAYPNLTDSALDAIYNYLNESNDGFLKLDSNAFHDPKRSFDSCQEYNTRKEKLISERHKLVKQNSKSSVNITMTQRPVNAPPETGPNTKPIDMVVPETPPAEYYTFNIETSGWYNVDIFLKDLPGFEKSELMVRLSGTFTATADVYMVLPGNKVFLRGGLVVNQQNVYAFFKNNGEIPLPQGAPAILFAIGYEKDKLSFATTSIKTSLKQSPELRLSAFTHEQINEAIANFNLAGLDFNSEKTKNFTAIKSVDSALNELESLKPVNWDCNCVRAYGPCDTANTVEHERE